MKPTLPDTPLYLLSANRTGQQLPHGHHAELA
jgi:hypothetical protein